MSELYEGVVVVGDSERVGSSFDSLDSRRTLRVVRFNERTLGVYPVALRSDLIDETAIDAIARQLSDSCGNALAVLYDNRSGLRAARLFKGGKLVRDFGEVDEDWVRLADDGIPIRTGAFCRSMNWIRMRNTSASTMRYPLASPILERHIQWRRAT